MQFGKSLWHTSVHETGKLNCGHYRTANRMFEKQSIKNIFAWRRMPVMHTQRNSESLKLFVDRPIDLRPQMFFEPLARYGNSYESKLGDRAIDFPDYR